MRTKLFLYNSVTSGTLQLITIMGGLILPRLYILTYGSEINGLITSVIQFVSYFSYVEAGLGTALIYSLYKPLAEKDQIEINAIATLAKRSYIKASGIYFLCVVCLSMVYPFIIKSETTDIKTMGLLVLVIGIFGALDFYTMAKYRVLLVADQKEYVLSIVLILAYIVNFALTVFMIHIKAYIVLVRVIPLVSFILRAALLYAYVKRKYPYVNYRQASPDTIHLKRRWDAFIMQLSVSVNISVPIVIVSVFCSLKLASVYSVYNIVFAGLIAIISIFTAGISASFGNLVAKKEFFKLEKIHQQFEFSIYAISAFLYASAFILIHSFIRIYTQGITDADYTNNLYGPLFIIWGILFNVRIPYTALINAFGKYRETRKVNISQVAFLLVLSLILVQYFQMVGVLIALILSALYWVCGLIIVVNLSMLEISPVKTFFRVIRMFVIVVVSYVPFLFGLQIIADTFTGWIFCAVKVSLWCGLVTLLINYLFDKKTFKEIIARFKGFIPEGTKG